MLKYYSHSGWRWSTLLSPPLLLLPVCSNHNNSVYRTRDVVVSINIFFSCSTTRRALKLGRSTTTRGVLPSTRCRARRRVRYNDEDEDEGEGEEEYGHNAEIAMLEMYSQSARDEVLLVKALVDDQEAEVLIFKGFSSCLSYGTSPDPSRSVLPARAVIKSIDRIRGPFDPSNILYLEKEITWESFKTRLQPN